MPKRSSNQTRSSRRLQRLSPHFHGHSLDRFIAKRKKQKQKQNILRRSKRKAGKLPDSTTYDNEPTVWKKRCLRSSSLNRPICSDYGLYRKQIYGTEGFYFCGNCDEYDSLKLINSRVKRNASKHQCKANHLSFLFSTKNRNDESAYLPSKTKILVSSTKNPCNSLSLSKLHIASEKPVENKGLAVEGSSLELIKLPNRVTLL